MIELTSDQLMTWMTSFLWPFVRILAFVMVAPILGETSVPRQVKVGIAAMLALIIAPTLNALPTVAPVSFAGIWLIIQQVVIGIALGLAMKVVFAAIQAAGDFIGLQMGLSFASFFSPDAGGTTMVLSRLLNLLAMLMFLAFNGHLVMIEVLTETFIRLPIGAGPLDASAWKLLVIWGGTIFSAGLLLALPLVTALLTINLVMGILNRASPQLSIFSVGFPVTLLTGVILLTFMTPELGSAFERMFQNGIETMVNVIEAMRS